MKGIEVLAATLNLTPLDFSGNLKKIRETFRFVNERDPLTGPPPKAKIVVFPALPIPSLAGDILLAPRLQSAVLHETIELASETRGLIAVLTLPLPIDGKVYHAAALMADGKILGFACSPVVPSDFTRWFAPWPVGERKEMTIGNDSFPVGDLVFEVGGVRLAIEFDPLHATSPDNPRDIDLYLSPVADPFEMGKAAIRRDRIRQLTRERESALIFANRLGNEGKPAIYDGESLIAQTGTLLAVERRFSYLDLSFLTATIDLDEIRKNRTNESAPSEWDDFDSAELPSPLTPTPPTDPTLIRFPGVFDWGFHQFRRRYQGFYKDPVPKDSESHLLAPWEKSDAIPFEEFPRAVASALFDYLRKSRSGGFLLSLSGGADSGAIAIILRLMVTFGFSAIGKRRFLERLAFIPEVGELLSKEDSAITEEEATGALLTTIYQKTENNSEVTRNAAYQVAKETGSVHYEISIDPVVGDYLKMISDSIGRPITWETDDLPLQNVQARSRVPSVWLLANLKKALLLATGNRSEVAAGYATMDGDTCGSLSPIAGVSKFFLRRWLRWMETTGVLVAPPLLGAEDGPPRHVRFPSLSFINHQQPTAELRPLSTHQTDEKDLMPYAVLDIIERGMIESRLLGPELTRFVESELKREVPEYSGTDEDQITAWIEKFQRLLAASQWKRYRYAPGFHLDRYDLSPSGFDFPSLSAGFGDWQFTDGDLPH